MLKAFAYIFSVYVLLLTTMPCTDTIDNAFLPDKHYEAGGRHNHSEEEFCSPFCACSCCGVTMNICTDFVSIGMALEKPAELNSFIPHFNLQEPAYVIWQPPKIA